MSDFPIMPLTLPSLLAEIPDPPKHFFIRGTFPDEAHRFLAVVGSRTYTSYGAQLCASLVRGLRGYSVVVVSGLALGIDGIAHKSALEAGVRTVAVPGSGLEDAVLYPRAHRTLAHQILEAGGALVSEFAPDWKPRPESFPQRNRIMAGLCHAVLVVEAEEKSGTLITARLASEYNRDVLALPGDVRSPTTKGPHLLIKTGACLVASPEDVLTALGIEKEKEKHAQAPLHTPQEALLCSLLPAPRETLVTELGKRGLDISTCNVLIASLELRDHIKEEGGYIVLL